MAQAGPDKEVKKTSDRLQGGSHIRNPKKTPMANLLLEVLDKMQVPAETFGDSTGKVAI